MDFDSDESKKNLSEKEAEERAQREVERTQILQKATDILKKEFEHSPTEVYLVGSVIRPYAFSSQSDVDVVLKNYKGDRFDLWTKLESQIGREVEVILFETCRFQEFVEKEGLKVV